MTEAYDLRSNIKGKAGSQGTLFQVKDKGLLNPNQRWPRGYTPERQNEVRSAMPNEVKGRYDADAPHQRARVVDTVSRSTMPTSHLEGLNSIGADALEGTAGTYWPNKSHLAVNMLDRNKWANDDSGQTLMHELGHHRDSNNTMDRYKEMRSIVSEVAEPRAKEGRSNYADPDAPVTGTERALAEKRVNSGVREATADTHMEEHYRTRGRNPQPLPAGNGRYEQNFTPEERESQYPGYNDVRPPASEHLGPQFADGHLF